MALEGTLRDFSLADIFQLIGLQRKTGVLTLRSKDDTVTVTFLDGKVVGADSLSHRLENRLGNVLIKSAVLTPDQLARALEIQKETLQRLGFILTHYGIISPDSLKSAIQLQILQIVYRLFRWKDGDYHFSQETTIEYDRDNVVPITAESILMEGARMIDEWPIIEKRIRSYDMVFRKKLTDQEIVVSDHADEIDFDESPVQRRRKPPQSDKIRISAEEKIIYDMVDGTMTVGDIVEVSRYSEFDTNKSLYELLTRDLIEEVRGQAAQAVQEQTPLDEAQIAETPVPLPLVIALALLALVSLATSFKNPLNSIGPLVTHGIRGSSISEARKAISTERIQDIYRAIEAYAAVNGRLPQKLTDLVPLYVADSLLIDPWGRAYHYSPQASEKFLLTGYTADGRPDPDLFLFQALESGPVTASSAPKRGGIQLVD
jgi:hypothetical protein